MQQVSLLAVTPLKANKTTRGAVYAHKRLLSKYICTVDVHIGIIIDTGHAERWRRSASTYKSDEKVRVQA